MLETLEFTEAVAEATDHIYEKVKQSVPRFEWELAAPLIVEINRLKKVRNAVILGHNYMVPEIFHGISDFKGDSLGLAREARDSEADVILFCGVHFMAETAKILNPGRTVLIPDPEAGCSLSESITVEDVRLLKERHPGIPVVTYMNTPAAIKAESDICCTSANAKAVVESLGSETVIFLPDEYLARNVAKETDVRVLTWHGTCMVHERFTVEEIRAYRAQYPGIEVISRRPSHHDHRVQHVGQRAGGASRARVHQALLDLPPHEDDHAREDPGLFEGAQVRGRGAGGSAGSGTSGGRAHAGGRPRLANRIASQLQAPRPDPIEHRLRQPLREGVLLTGVV